MRWPPSLSRPPNPVRLLNDHPSAAPSPAGTTGAVVTAAGAATVAVAAAAATTVGEVTRAAMTSGEGTTPPGAEPGGAGGGVLA